MSFDLGELVAKMKLDDSDFSTKMRGAANAARKAASDSEGYWRDSAGKLRNARGQFAAAGEHVGEGATSGIQSGMSRGSAALGSFIGNLGAQLAAKLGSLAVAGVEMGLSVAGQMENASIAFTTMLGSGEKAGVFLEKLKAFAAATPFEFPGLQTAASSLISAGINADKVIPIMTTLGNVTSGMGTGAEGVQRATRALQQMQAAGKITGEDLNQLRDAGIPVYDLLAAATGKSKDQVVALANAGKLGKTELDAMMSALESGKGMEKFGGLMEKQSHSLIGMWSTFKDTLGMGLADAIAPALPAIKDALGGISSFLGNTVFPGITAGINWVSDAVKLFKGTLSGDGADVDIPGMNAIIDFAAGVGAIIDRITPVWDALTGKGAQVSPLMAEMATKTSTLSTMIQTVGSYWTSTWQNMQAIINAAIPVVMPMLESLGGVFINTIIPALATMYTALMTWSGQVQAVVTSFIVGFMAKVQPMLPTITAIFQGIGDIISTVVQIIIALVGPMIQGLSDMWAQHGDRIMNVVGAAFGAIVNTISYAINFISEILKAVLAAIHGDWTGAWEHLQKAGAAIWNLITNNIIGAVEVMRAAIGDKVSAVLTFFRELPDNISSAVGNLGNLLKAQGQAIIDGFFNGLKSSWNKVTDFVGGIASWISANKGPLSYDYTLLQPAGNQIMKGLGDSMKAYIPTLKSDLNLVTSTIAGTSAAMAGAGSAGGSARSGFPEMVNLIDEDGAVLAKLRVEARAAMEEDWSVGASLGLKEGASR